MYKVAPSILIGMMLIGGMVTPAETVEPETTYIDEGIIIDYGPVIKSLGEFVTTGYCSCERCCGEWADGITATGTTAVMGRTIAVDPSVIPYGTKVIIDGHQYIAEDCGGAIKKNKIDIFFDSHDAALYYGVQLKEIKIVID